MTLSHQQEARLKECESLSDPELALFSELSGKGLDSPDRAALARYELNRRCAAIRDGREERTLAIAEQALSISKDANRIASEDLATAKTQALWAKWAAIIAVIAAIAANLNNIINLFSN